jgi:hypothetical protein
MVLANLMPPPERRSLPLAKRVYNAWQQGPFPGTRDEVELGLARRHLQIRVSAPSQLRGGV